MEPALPSGLGAMRNSPPPGRSGRGGGAPRRADLRRSGAKAPDRSALRSGGISHERGRVQKTTHSVSARRRRMECPPTSIGQISRLSFQCSAAALFLAIGFSPGPPGNADSAEQLARIPDASVKLNLLKNCDASFRSKASGVRRWGISRDATQRAGGGASLVHLLRPRRTFAENVAHLEKIAY